MAKTFASGLAETTCLLDSREPANAVEATCSASERATAFAAPPLACYIASRVRRGPTAITSCSLVAHGKLGSHKTIIDKPVTY